MNLKINFMNIVYLTITIVLVAFQTKAQNPDGQLSDVTFGKTAITHFADSPKKLTRTCFINDNWLTGEFEILDGVKFKNLPMRFNMVDHQLYFQDNNSTRVISLDLLNEFSWTNSSGEEERFVSGKTLGKSSVEVFKAELTDEVSLYSRYSTKIIRANYNEALAVGDKTDQIKLVKELYFRYDDNNLIEIPKSKKKAIESFPTQYTKELSNFVNKEKL